MFGNTASFRRALLVPSSPTFGRSNVMVSPGDSDERIVLTLNWEGRELKIPAAYRHWEKGRAAYPRMSLSKLADEPVAADVCVWS